MGAFLATALFAQPLPRALEDSAFGSCGEVLKQAVALSAEIHQPAYVMELYPRTRGSVEYLFPSEETVEAAARWIASHDAKTMPGALFYFSKGAYTLRCRDNQGRYMKYGPPGALSPLDVKVGSGKGEIWYFYRRREDRHGFAYIVTDVSLESLTQPDEIRLMIQVQELMNARFVQAVYLRNDPWFLGTAPNSLIYLFTDAFPKITLEQYRASKTMWCNENGGCHFYSFGAMLPSHFGPAAALRSFLNRPRRRARA